MAFEKPVASPAVDSGHKTTFENPEATAREIDQVAFMASSRLMDLHDPFIRGRLKPIDFANAARAVQNLIFDELCRRLGVPSEVAHGVAKASASTDESVQETKTP